MNLGINKKKSNILSIKALAGFLILLDTVPSCSERQCKILLDELSKRIELIQSIVLAPMASADQRECEISNMVDILCHAAGIGDEGNDILTS